MTPDIPTHASGTVPRMPVIDLWANVVSPAFAERWTQSDEAQGAKQLFGDGLFSASQSLDDLLSVMDGAGVDGAVITLPFRPPESCHRDGLFAAEDLLEAADAHAAAPVSGLYVAASVNEPNRPPPRPRKMVERVRSLAAHPRFVLVRIAPFLDQIALDDARYYPLYAACEELELAVAINVGVPGPRADSDCQHPRRLERVLIDFPDLTVIGAHMGHPYESLLVTFMLKWEHLYLSNSAYLADYMDEGLVRFMNSSRGRGRVLFASDHPVIPMGRALESARKLPLDEASMNEFLGDATARVLRLHDRTR